MEKITVGIPSYIINEDLLQLTKNAVESLENVYLIIVDNGSKLGGGYLRSVADIYIRNRENLGYAKAVNQIIKLKKTELLALMNNDTRISPNWQKVVKEVFSLDDKIYSCHFRMTDYNIPFTYGNTIAITGKERWCTGSFFVIDRNKFNELYDENFLNSYDDWDYFMRVRKAGLKTAYTDKACYQHYHSFTQQQIPEREENNQRNREYFKKKWGRFAEDIFTEQYPEQINKNYKEGFVL